MKDEVTTMFNREESSETNVVTENVSKTWNRIDNLTHFSKDYQPTNNGRPKGSRNLSTVLREKINEIAPDEIIDSEIIKRFSQSHKGRILTNNDALACVLLNNAIVKQDLAAIKEIADRTEGKVAQRLEVEQTNQNSPIIEKLQQLSAIYAQALDDHTAKIKALEALKTSSDAELLAEIDAVEGEFLGI